MMERPKMGFAIPVENWLAKELKELVIENLGKPALRLHNLFNEDEVEKIVNDFFNVRKEKYLKIWHLLMFQIWYKKWN